jgi:hypothetical protein
MRRPAPRGPLSDELARVLALTPDDTDTHALAALAEVAAGSADLLHDDDVQIALLALYELHYSGLDDVDDRWEWAPALLAVRARLEAAVEAELRAVVPVPDLPSPDQVPGVLTALTADDGGPGLAAFLARKADRGQAAEWLMHRSVYQLKEADPHTWAIPRLRGPAKAALVEIQADEYGGGDPDRVHATIFARTLRGTGLDDTPGAYVDAVPALTLAAVNTMSMFGLHRRLRGCVVGHLAAFEMTSTMPNRRYGQAFRRLGYDSGVTEYFDEHVEADAVHEQIAAHDMAGRLALDEPDLADDIVFGAAACLHLDALAAAAQLAAFQDGRSSLREPDRAVAS